MGLFLGKFRGVVTNVSDPEGLGRIKAQVPAVTGTYETGWCLPCFSCAGGDHGVFFLPSVGDQIWVEFEQGKVDYPIWSGCWLPKTKKSAGNAIIKTADGNIHLRDGEIWLTNAKGESVNISSLLTELKQLRIDFGNADDNVRKEFAKADSELKSWVQSNFYPR